MRNSEVKLQEHTDEFIQAAGDLHAKGMDWFYVSDVNKQMARNDAAKMRRHEIASKAFGLLGIKLGEPTKGAGATYPITARLEREGRLESEWEAGVLQAPDQPLRRLYRLTEAELDAVYETDSQTA